METRRTIDNRDEDGSSNNGPSNDGRHNGRRPVDRRHEPRISADISLMVWGVDTRGARFLQEARARDISRSGALLAGLDAELRSGDVIGILYAGSKARFRVVWTRYDETGDKMQVAVHRFASDECPWKELLTEEPADDKVTIDPAAPEPPQ